MQNLVRNDDLMTTGKSPSPGTAINLHGKTAPISPALLRLREWLLKKVCPERLSALADIVGPLIQAEELIKLDPTIGPRLKVRYATLRERLHAQCGSDVVGDLANAPAIGKLSVEAHSRAVVASYCEHIGMGNGRWFDELTQEAVAAAERAHRLYFE